MALAESKIPDTLNQTAGFRNIVVAVDFSPSSRRALSTAPMLADANCAHLTVLHVLQSDWRYELAGLRQADLETRDAEPRITTWIGELASDRPGLKGKIDSMLVKNGPIAPAILSIAVQLGADLLVMGTHGRGGLSKFAIGSVSEELLRLAPVPVMTVGPKAEMSASAAPCAHAILFATDFGPGSKRALPFVLQLTRARNAKLVLLHMISPMPAASSLSAYAPSAAAADEFDQWSGAVRTRALKELRESLPADCSLQQDPAYLVGTDFLPEGILAAAGKFNVDLIVMGANRTASAKLAAHVPWTAVHEVLVHAPCPVLTFAG